MCLSKAALLTAAPLEAAQRAVRAGGAAGGPTGHSSHGLNVEGQLKDSARWEGRVCKGRLLKNIEEKLFFFSFPSIGI